MIAALKPLRAPLLRIGVVLTIFMLQRVLFVLMDQGAFPHTPASAFIGGARFDLSAIAWCYLPWILCVLIAPGPTGILAAVQRALFHLSNVLCFFLNCTDLVYFHFTLKRSTADLFNIAAGGNDLTHLAPVFLQDYWYVVLVFLGSIALAEWGYRRAAEQEDVPARPWWVWRLVLIGLTVLASRGGWQYIPLGVLDAAQYAPPAYMPVVLNTPFTVMTSIGKPVVAPVSFMSEQEADHLWPVVHAPMPAAVPDSSRPNVVVIILESFSAAYSGLLNGTGRGHMPFLDSLMQQGIWHQRAYANGRRSIDGIPAVIASMPKMMGEAFITSPYATTPITTLPGLLAAEGYATSFFHGGHNGTMGFDAFARSAGFQRYVGRNEYPDSRDDDGVWGIRDRPFLRFIARELEREPSPFMSCIFTLSSHHPYHLPPEEAARFEGGELPIHATLRYADDALRDFFRDAQGMDWYRNTLFVITADHTADLERNGQESGSAFDHWIPLAYFRPGHIAPRMDARTTQQIDILPTVLDLIGHHRPYFAFGSSSLRHERIPAAITEGNGTWMIITDSLQLRSDGQRVLWQDGRPDKDGEAHRTLQAAIQQFNTHLLRRSLAVKGP